MSRNAKQKQKAGNTIVRSKKNYPTAKKAMRSLELAGIKAHQLKTSRHSGTYWMWEIER